MQTHDDSLPLREAIQALDDRQAVRVLATIAEAHGRGAAAEAPSPGLGRALHDALAGGALGGVGAQDAGALPGPAPSDGEAARAGLLLLAEEERFRGPLRAMLVSPPADRFGLGPVEITALAAGLLFALQTHIRVERKPDGKWSILVEKKPTSPGLLRPLVSKLAALLGLK